MATLASLWQGYILSDPPAALGLPALQLRGQGDDEGALGVRKENKMESYKNLGGDSGVRAYEIGTDSIRVQFSDGSLYLYTYQSAGSANIEKMKQLAIAGEGLNSFIMRNVRKFYAAKLR